MSVHPDTDSDPSAEGFAERWSRRKQEAGREEAQQPVQSRLAGKDADADPAPQLTDDDMPPVESLDERSDYAAFLSPGVSEHLRAQALRKLFQLPGLHLPDGLDDYDDDFTGFTELGKTITHEMQRMLNRELAAGEPAEDPDSQTVAQATVEPAAPLEDLPHKDQQQSVIPARADDEDTSERQG